MSTALLPRSAPADQGVSSRAVAALLDRLAAKGIECHSLMVVRHGHVIAEGWWAPYSAERPHLLYSLTKSFTSIAVGLAVEDGLLSLDDRVADVLPDHVPSDAPEQALRLTVHHLLTMTAGHETDTLVEAWEREPQNLVKGFLSIPAVAPEGTLHTYDNATTFILARMVERVTGRPLDEFLDERLFVPMGIADAEWDRVGSGAVFGFHGLHLRTEAIAAFGELLLRGGLWGGRRLVAREWVELATRSHIVSRYHDDIEHAPDFRAGYGYQIWMSRHGFHGNGAFGQHCIVVPAHDLVVAVTSAQTTVEHAQDVLDAVSDCLLPGIGHPTPAEDRPLDERMRDLRLSGQRPSEGTARGLVGTIDASVADSALPHGTTIRVEPTGGGWTVLVGSLFEIEVGHEHWRESSPLGRPLAASGGWQGDTFVTDLQLVASPHRVRLTVDRRAATATWTTVPLTTSDLLLHLTAPLMTRPDVA
ncbi:beta-lactamase family protein [Microbacterium sp. KUDC0406]|uniref:serine hydrolase domain-containing protein n=1 Tax=Microbacterium sp. KUDC0406 TaxID=2909588 RepID=UPI001F21C8D8|nr:serine hydrolase domain-containing protein [Microbacterium sp. KUDC0406]UJP10732.1 beta-lactamase family protein [Microbacterium sp. KUDC0406]